MDFAIRRWPVSGWETGQRFFFKGGQRELVVESTDFVLLMPPSVGGITESQSFWVTIHRLPKSTCSRGLFES
jgi:hypothetical protein